MGSPQPRRRFPGEAWWTPNAADAFARATETECRRKPYRRQFSIHVATSEITSKDIKHTLGRLVKPDEGTLLTIYNDWVPCWYFLRAHVQYAQRRPPRETDARTETPLNWVIPSDSSDPLPGRATENARCCASEALAYFFVVFFFCLTFSFVFKAQMSPTLREHVK